MDVITYSQMDVYFTTNVGRSTIPEISSGSSLGIDMFTASNSIEFFFNRPSLYVELNTSDSYASASITSLYVYEVDSIPFLSGYATGGTGGSINSNIVIPTFGTAPQNLGSNVATNINNISLSQNSFGQLNLVSQNLLPGNQINNRNTEGV